MSAIEAGLAVAWLVLMAGWPPENSETQISAMMTILKQISTNFSGLAQGLNEPA